MGNSASVSQGSSTGTHEGDARSSTSEKQHDWPIVQAVASEQDVQSLQEMRKPYNGAQRAARKSRDLPENRNQKKSVRKDENKSPVLQDDSSSSGDERDAVPEDQRRHQPSPRPRPRSPPPQIENSSSDEEEQQQRSSRQRKRSDV